MVSYLLIFMGSCSPIHCRIIIPLVGIASILISIKAGSVLGYYLGYFENEIHQTLPILMLGIGIDDIIVIMNSIDQISLDLSPQERLVKGLGHSGVSITITSLTNSLVFLSGKAISLEYIQSFCIYASVTIIMLYFSVLTIFVSVVYWDAKRIH